MRYPFDKKYVITQKFGQTNAALTGGVHKGTDYGCPSGTEIKAITSGTVIGAGYDPTGGNYVSIKTGDLVHKYFHLSAIKVGYGATVSEGQLIGLSGATGLVTGPHLHLQTERNGVPIDPEGVINNGGVSNTPAPTPPANSEFYAIKPGDTFWGLEEAWHVPHGQLQALNPGVDPKRLQIGQQIRIISPPVTVQPVNKKTYSIKPGDTFWDLENAWQLPHGRLQQLNPSLDPRKLQIGQTIIIG